MDSAESLSAFQPSISSISPGFVAGLLLAAATGAVAGPGDLDPSFGNGGRVFIDISNDTDVAATIVLQADGKLVVGRANNAIDDDFSVLRFNVDGSLDMSFGSGGRTSLDYSGIKGTTRVVLQQADGKIIAAGTSYNTLDSDGTDFGLARYNVDGSVDTSFGVGGVVIHDLGSQNDVITAIVQQGDGRLVAAGYTYGGEASNRDMAFVGFTPDGTLDASFGSNGSTIINFYEWKGPDYVKWLTQQADGMLVAVGTVWPSSATSRIDIGVVRLDPDGFPDPGFDGDGRVAVDLYATPKNAGGDAANAGSIALQQDGRIVVAGTTNSAVWDYDDCLPWLARLNSDGSLDMSFGDGGAAPLPFCSCRGLHGLAIAMNGDFYLAGGTTYNNRDHLVARVTQSGELDSSYGIDGLAIVDVGNGNDLADSWHVNQGIIIQPDGKVVTLASTSVGDSSGRDVRLVVARLLADGDSPGVLGFKGSPTDVSEASGVVEIMVRRTGGSSGAVSIDYQTQSIAATSDADFAGAAGTLTWTDGDVADKSISIRLVDDTEIEGSEDLKLTLFNVSGGANLATTELSVWIEDDDSPAPSNPSPRNPALNSGGSGAIGCEALIAIALLLSRAMRTMCRSRMAFTILVRFFSQANKVSLLRLSWRPFRGLAGDRPQMPTGIRSIQVYETCR